MKGTRDEDLKHVIERCTRLYWDIKDLKDRDKPDRARLPFLGAALADAFDA